MSESPADLKYTKEHEWARAEGTNVRVGITRHAVDALGDITLMNFTAKPGDRLTPGQSFGTVESVKTLSDVYAPVAGTVIAVNAELNARPEAINENPYGVGWMVLVEASAGSNDLAGLLDAEAYQAYLGTL